MFFFQLCFFRFHQKNEFLPFFLVGKFSVLLRSTANLSSFTRRSEETCFLNRFEFSLVQTTFPFCTKLEWNKISFWGFLCFLVGDFFIFWLWIVHVIQENRTVSILKRDLAFSFHFQHFSAEECNNPQSFFCRLLFAKKNWNKEAPCNTEKPPLRMETYPVLFWFVFLKFLRIVLLHLESLMLIKKWNHNHSEQINIHSEWRQNFTKRMHQPACKMEKYRFWIGKSPCMLSFIFVQVWPKGMKHHLFRTNNFHSAWRFLRFIFEHIDTFLFTMGTNNSPFKCFISTLLSSWLQHLWVGFFKIYKSRFLKSWVMFFASFQIRVFPQGESVFPTHVETLLFCYSPPAGAS